MKIMDHQQAMQLKAPERYLLGELKGDTREQFEAHFFECVECARDVEEGAVFMDAAREILKNEATPVPAVQRPTVARRRWFEFVFRPAFAGPVFAVLLLAVVYQIAYLIPHMRAELSEASEPSVLSWYSLVAQNSRGEESLTIHTSPNGKFGLFMDIPPEKHFPSYTCELETQSGSPEFSVNVSSENAASNLQLLIPASRLGPGKHILVVRGGNSPGASPASQTEVARFEFTLEFSK
jgi:hypothetical protein